MLSLLVESAVRSLLLGGTVWLGLRLLRPRDPRVQMTAWTAVLIASLAMPLVMRWGVVTIPSVPASLPIVQLIEDVPNTLLTPISSQSDAQATAIARRAVEAASNTAASARDGRSISIDWRAIATAIYTAVAFVLLLRLLIGLALTWRLVRAAAPVGNGWDNNVRVSDVVGVPVTFGSIILLPPECCQWAPAKRAAVLSHERAHVRHGDFYVLLLAALNRAVFWFSPLAWWQFARMAELAEMVSDDAAIEVLADRSSYAGILLDLAGSVAHAPAGLAMARAGTVRQRISRILAMRGLPVHAGWRTQLAVGVALIPLAAICAAGIARGIAPLEPANVDAKNLDAFVGFYQINALHAIAVTRERNHLFAQETGGAKLELVAQGPRRFASADGNSAIVFAGDDDKHAVELTMQEPARGGRRAKLVDAAIGQAIEDAFVRRVAAAPDRFKAQAPAEGGKSAVLQAIGELQRGAPDYNRMDAPLVERVRAQLPRLAAMLTALGSAESIFFRGVGPGGYDIYGAKFANGFAEFRVLVGAGGKLEDLLFRPDGDDTPGGIVSCAQEPGLKPVAGTAPIKLLIFNTTGADVQLFALDQSGKRAHQVTIGDNRTSPIMTYVARPWVVADAAGQCLEIVMPGQHTRFVTIRSAGTGERRDAALARRATPMPGSEEALRHYIDALARGEPDYERLTPEVAAVTRQQALLNQAILAKLGPVRAVSFRGVTPLDNDLSMVYFAGGSAEWRIGLVKDGRIGRIALGPQY
jgi:beta-lactamase regulating signal transducer with metallopeptidase domain